MDHHHRDHAQILLAVDLAILTVRDDRLHVVLIERENGPFRAWLALPGGFMRGTETPEAAALRELQEEAGLNGAQFHLEQLPVCGAPDRDPRGRVVTVPFLAIAPNLPVPVAGTDARAARWEPVEEAMAADRLAFDHGSILATALERARTQLEYTTVAAAFCDDAFTIGDLRHVYEVVWGAELDAGNFSRKVAGTDGFILPTEGKRASGTGRPATLYRRGPARRLHPPMLRGLVESRSVA